MNAAFENPHSLSSRAGGLPVGFFRFERNTHKPFSLCGYSFQNASGIPKIFEADLLRQQSEADEKKRMSSQLIPTAQHILEHDSLLSAEEKNRLWKLVLKKATVYRTQDDEWMIHMYPNLPQ